MFDFFQSTDVPAIVSWERWRQKTRAPQSVWQVRTVQSRTTSHSPAAKISSMPTAARRERLCHLSAGSSVQPTLPAAVPWLMQLSQPPSWRWAAATCPKETVLSAVWPNISMLPKSWGQYGCSLSRMVVRRTDSTGQIAYADSASSNARNSSPSYEWCSVHFMFKFSSCFHEILHAGRIGLQADISLVYSRLHREASMNVSARRAIFVSFAICRWSWDTNRKKCFVLHKWQSSRFAKVSYSQCHFWHLLQISTTSLTNIHRNNTCVTTVDDITWYLSLSRVENTLGHMLTSATSEMCQFEHPASS